MLFNAYLTLRLSNIADFIKKDLYLHIVEHHDEIVHIDGQVHPYLPLLDLHVLGRELLQLRLGLAEVADRAALDALAIGNLSRLKT